MAIVFYRLQHVKKIIKQYDVMLTASALFTFSSRRHENLSTV